jgi:hypothetical protein
VSKLAGSDQLKLLGARELGEFDSVKKASILIMAIYMTQPPQSVVVPRRELNGAGST